MIRAQGSPSDEPRVCPQCKGTGSADTKETDPRPDDVINETVTPSAKNEVFTLGPVFRKLD